MSTIKAPALRVIIAQLKDRADATLTAYKKKHPESDYHRAREAREAHMRAALRDAMLNNPLKYLKGGRVGAHGDIGGNKAWGKLVEKIREQFPEVPYERGDGVCFAALNVMLAVPKPDIAKWTKLAKEIDNAFLEEDAESIVALIAKTFA
jgi:hypothetical protein